MSSESVGGRTGCTEDEDGEKDQVIIDGLIWQREIQETKYLFMCSFIVPYNYCLRDKLHCIWL